MAKLLGLSVVLVVDASAMARSAAAVIHGFVSFDPELQVCGVILNNVGGRAHADMIRDAVGGAVPIFGAIPHATDLVVAERHLGLFLPHEIRSGHLDELADLIEKHVDLDLLLNKSVTDRRPVPAVPEPLPLAVRIGVARDEAFCFYYTDNLELLERAGAKLVEFSPLNDPIPDDLDGLYIGGGYPELHADKLAANTATLKAVREFAEAGGPIYAECGGLMYLARNLHIDGTTYPLCGVLPFDTKMPATLKIAYVEVNTAGGLFGVGHVARGHMFHASEIAGELTEPNGYHVETSRGEHIDEGYSVGNVLASYAHLHFASQPALASAFVSRCLEFRASANASRGSSTASVI
jgi:cobyrinic acid a,c-diamide synthase